MDITEIKQKKAELEMTIFQLIEQFNGETDARIFDISINYEKMFPFGKPVQVVIIGVDIEILL